MQSVRFGIIGMGGMGGGHARYFDAVEGVKLTAICDINPATLDRWAGELKVPAYRSHKELIASGQVDAVLIATPHYDHPVIAADAFAAGLHVLSEKPIAVTVGNARKLNQIASRHPGQKFGIMFQQRTSGVRRKMRDMVAGGELGPITRISWIITNWFRGWAYYASGGWRATWSGEGGGVLLNQCPHTLDQLQWIPGMVPARVTAVVAIAKRHPIEVEDEVSAILEYDNGAIGHFTTTTGEAPGSDRLEIAGENGLLIAEHGKLTFRKLRHNTAYHMKSPEVWPRIESSDIDIPHDHHGEDHKMITQNFVRAVLHDEPLIAPGTEGVKGLEIGNAMLMSGMTRRPVDLPLDAEAFEQLLEDLKRKYGGKKTLSVTDGAIATDPKFA